MARKGASLLLFLWMFFLRLWASFVVVGDVRITHMDPLMRYYNPRFVALEREINLLRPGAVFIIGDLVYGYTEDRDELIRQWKGFIDELKLLKEPVYLVPGNHEIFGEKYAEKLYRRFAGPLHWARVINGDLFVALNTDEIGYEDTLSPSQFKFLSETLEKYRAVKNKYILMHKPLWWKYQDHRFWKRSFHPLMVRYKVKAVFAGHYHEYDYMEKDGVKYIVTGGGGAEQEGGDFIGAFPHFVLVDGGKFTVFSHRGILPVDFARREDKERVKAYFNGITPMLTPGRDRRTELHFKNPFKKTLKFKINFGGRMPFSASPEEIKAFLTPTEGFTSDLILRMRTSSLSRLLPPPFMKVEAWDQEGNLYYTGKFELKIPTSYFVRKLYIGEPVKFTRRYALEWELPEVFRREFKGKELKKLRDKLLKNPPVLSGKNGVFDLEATVFPNKGVYIFAMAALEFPEKGEREVYLECSKPLRVFLNGREVRYRRVGEAVRLREKFSKGKNYLILLMAQRSGPWRLRILKGGLK